MLDNPPRESELRPWTRVAHGIVVIYATSPVTPALREVIDRSPGREIFIYAGSLMLILFAGTILGRVSNALITRVGQGEIAASFLLTIGITITAGYWPRREPGTGLSHE